MTRRERPRTGSARRPPGSRAFALPNLLTYSRIAAVPVVAALPVRRHDLRLRILAALGRAVRVRRGRAHRSGRRLGGAHLWRAVVARAHARSDRRQAAGRRYAVVPGVRRHDPRLVDVGGLHHPVPGDSGVRHARIPRRAARERAGVAAGQMEDGAAEHRGRLPGRGAGGRPGAARRDLDRNLAAVGRGDPDALHGLRLFPRRAQHFVDE